MNFSWKASTEPQRAFKAALIVGAEDGLVLGDEGGQRFSQKRVWLMCPPALKLRLFCRWIWETMFEVEVEVEREERVVLSTLM